MTYQQSPETCQHDYQTHYYGLRCAKCGDLIPDNCEMWIPIDDYEVAREEYRIMHWTCKTCGGEHGDGWTTCQCEDDLVEEAGR